MAQRKMLGELNAPSIQVLIKRSWGLCGVVAAAVRNTCGFLFRKQFA
jgi:hypothetical protein